MSTVPTPDSPSWFEQQPDGPPGPEKSASWRSWAAAGVVTVVLVAVGIVLLNRHSGNSTAASTAQTPSGQTQGQPRAFNGAVGKVVTVDGSTLTIDAQDQSGSTTKVTVKTSSDTTVSETVDGSLTDLKVGDNVVAFGTTTADGVKATQITDSGDQQNSFGPGGGSGNPPSGQPGQFPQSGEAPPGGFPQGGEGPQGGFPNGGGLVAGSITKVDGSTVTVKTSDGSTKTITASGATKVSVSQARTISDIKVGDTIQARGDRSGDVVTAASIRLGAVGFGGGFPGGGFPGAGGTNSSTPTTTN